MKLNDLTKDNDLVSAIKKDNTKAYELLFNRYKRKIYYFASGYLEITVEAEEVVQNTFISIWQHRKKLDNTLSIKSYIYKTASNLIYNLLKKQVVRNRYIEHAAAKTPLTDKSHDEIFYQDLKKTMEAIIKTMPAQQKKIFNLSRSEGLSHEEIAKQLNISVRTVENQVYRALKLLKKGLTGELFL